MEKRDVRLPGVAAFSTDIASRLVETIYGCSVTVQFQGDYAWITRADGKDVLTDLVDSLLV